MDLTDVRFFGRGLVRIGIEPVVHSVVPVRARSRTKALSSAASRSISPAALIWVANL